MNGLMEETSSYNADRCALYEEVFKLRRDHVNKAVKCRLADTLQKSNISRHRYRDGLYSYLLWWGIGAGIGVLFATAVDSSMKQLLAEHLQNEVKYMMEYETSVVTYFLKRCLCYTQLFLFIWCMDYFAWGYLGVRILMLGRGFIYGFSQTAWVLSYGVNGIFLGLLSYLPHNILFTMVIAWMEWIFYKNPTDRSQLVRKIGSLIGVMVPVISWLEAYISRTMFLSSI